AFEGFPDRFINLCTKNGIPLWNIKNVGGRLSASTTIQGYLNIRECAKKSGMNVRVVEKKGLIFFLKKQALFVAFLKRNVKKLLFANAT
ncbi:MAG: sporulation protein YqfD, partial [Clostridia bacterium]|nr:sporulation protein YqfD [Clostridia bacterium]